jgi:hypothetical protein
LNNSKKSTKIIFWRRINMLTKRKIIEFFFDTRIRTALTAGIAGAVALGATEGAAALGAAGAQKLYVDAETAILALFDFSAGKGTEIAAHLIPDLGIPALAAAIAAATKGIYNKFKFGFFEINSKHEAISLRAELQLLIIAAERQEQEAASKNAYGTVERPRLAI